MGQRKKMIPPLVTRDLARRLLDYEAAAGTTSMPMKSAGIRVYEKLRRSLCALAGVAGFNSLASRAVTLARSHAPGLKAVQVSADGLLQGLGEVEQIDDHQAGEGEVVLIAQLLELLLIFIGESLTLSLVRDVWPDLAIDDAIPGMGDKRERAR
jgi:hypothetical protein